MIELKKIAVRYPENKCGKCERVMQVGWSAWYQPEGKKLFCVPCGDNMINSGKAKDTTVQSEVAAKPDEEEENLLMNELAGNVRLYNEMLTSFGDSIRIVRETINAVEAELKAMRKEVQTAINPPKAKTTKK